MFKAFTFKSLGNQGSLNTSPSVATNAMAAAVAG